MLKEQTKDLEIVKVLKRNEYSIIYLLKDGRVFKSLSPYLIYMYNIAGISLERKILEGERLKDYKEFYEPLSAVYNGVDIVGYTMAFIDYLNFVEYDKTLQFEQIMDLGHYAKIYNELEQVVKKGNELDLVFPDLCTAENIYISSDSEFSLGDYDGFQVGNFGSVEISTVLGEQKRFNSSKFRKDKFLYTKELDKYSLMILYFLDTFNIKIGLLGVINPYTGKRITMDYLMDYINLKNKKIITMIENTLSTDKEGAYVSEVANALNDLYELDLVPIPNTKDFHKILVRK